MTNEWLKRQRKAMHLCTECGEPLEMRADGRYYSMCEQCRDEARKETQGTLCWHCKNAVPNIAGTVGCNWSRKKKPVDGWEATPTQLKIMGNKTVQSYFVKKCPEFKEG